jgi:ribosome-interacting GTPase 1
MPANLTPQYHKAEQAYKEAATIEEKIAALQEMLAVIPKHKGTDHLQGDLKRKLAKLREEATKPKAKKSFDPFRVPKQGAGQVLVLGPPNSGKSSLVARTTRAPVQVTDFPFATQGPIPGMMLFEDVQIQLVDLPPITRDFLPAGMLGLIKSADAVLLLCDLASEQVLEEIEAVLETLADGRVRFHDPGRSVRGPASPEGELITRVPALLLANKIDLAGSGEILSLLRELYQGRFEPLPVSCSTGSGLGELPDRVFRLLDRIRIYSKEPGKPPDLESPFVLKRGQTVLDLAAHIHREFPEHLRQARVWGSARFDGQAVQKDYVLADRDVVELQVDV